MRILLVEDEFLVRDTVAYELREQGFEVIEAATGDEARAVCAGGGFDVLVTDIRMPGETSGWDLAELCRAQRPDLPVVYMTGYSHVAHRQVAGSLLLQKPFSLDALRQAIDAVARGAGPT